MVLIPKARKEMESKKKMPPPSSTLPSAKPAMHESSRDTPQIQLQMEVYKDGAKIQDVNIKKEVDGPKLLLIYGPCVHIIDN